MKPSLLVVLALAASPAAAHDTWLALAGPPPASGGRAELELTSAGTFPEPESAVAADRLARTGLRLAGRTQSLEASPGGAKTLRLTVPAAANGAAVAWIETRPRTLTLAPDELSHYLDEIGAGDALRREWKTSGLAAWRESYVKIAKACFRVGDAGDGGWAEPLGLDFEIVPESDPSTLRAGGSLAVRLLWRGEPAAGFALGAASGGRSLPLRTTDADGRAAFAIDAAGPWLIRATRIERASLPGADWRSWFTTLTFAAGRAGE